MAMLPFCGYNMADYWEHWFEMGEKLGDKAPKIFNVNWFRTDDEGNFIWPGFGDNLRVLEWIIKRCEGKADAEETPIGFVPKAEDINLEGLDFDLETLKGIQPGGSQPVDQRAGRHQGVLRPVRRQAPRQAAGRAGRLAAPPEISSDKKRPLAAADAFFWIKGARKPEREVFQKSSGRMRHFSPCYPGRNLS